MKTLERLFILFLCLTLSFDGCKFGHGGMTSWKTRSDFRLRRNIFFSPNFLVLSFLGFSNLMLLNGMHFHAAITYTSPAIMLRRAYLLSSTSSSEQTSMACQRLELELGLPMVGLEKQQLELGVGSGGLVECRWPGDLVECKS